MIEIIGGLVRHGLTAVGVVILGGSDFSTDDVATIAGALVTIGSVLWSVWNKRQQRLKGGGQ